MYQVEITIISKGKTLRKVTQIVDKMKLTALRTLHGFNNIKIIL